MRLAIAAASTIMAASCAQAADISVTPVSIPLIGASVPAGSLIVMTGALVPEDWPKFVEATKDIPEGRAAVVLSGPGGHVFTAIRIGNLIHQKGWDTMGVDFCASACGLIWLAGHHRVLDVNSRVGFHAAYVKQGDENVEKGAPNALVGAYLSKLGLSYEAIAYLTTAAPSSLTWLNDKDAIEYGIPYEQVGEQQIHKTTAEPGVAPSTIVLASPSEPLAPAQLPPTPPPSVPLPPTTLPAALSPAPPMQLAPIAQPMQILPQIPVAVPRVRVARHVPIKRQRSCP